MEQVEVGQKDDDTSQGISSDNDYDVHLIRLPNPSFVNSYPESGLTAWEVNIDIQPIFRCFFFCQQ